MTITPAQAEAFAKIETLYNESIEKAQWLQANALRRDRFVAYCDHTQMLLGQDDEGNVRFMSPLTPRSALILTRVMIDGVARRWNAGPGMERPDFKVRVMTYREALGIHIAQAKANLAAIKESMEK